MRAPDDLYDLLAHHAACTPGEIAAVDAPAGERLTYAELRQRVDTAAVEMLDRGVAVGDVVAILSFPCASHLILCLAGIAIGAVVMGVNPRYRRPEIEYLFADAQPKLVYVIADNNGQAAVIGEGAFPGAQISGKIVDVAFGCAGLGENLSSIQSAGVLAMRRHGLDPCRASLLVYTSGTTGKPKGALLPARGVARGALVQAEWLRDAYDRVVNFMPIDHIGCLCAINANVLARGGTVFFTPHFSPDSYLQIAESERATGMMLPPTVLQMIFNGLEPKPLLPDLRAIVWGGSALPDAAMRAISTYDVRFFGVYGQTEATHFMLRTPPQQPLALAATILGEAIEGVEVRLRRDDGRSPVPGEPGELQVRSDHAMLGYLNRPEATAEVFTEDGFLRTGDLAAVRPDGYFTFVGRKREMFKSGGQNIYPIEIEKVIEALPGIQTAVVIPVPDALYDEVGHAFVIAEADKNWSAAAIVAHLRENLANYKIPKQVHLVASLPMLPSGKPDRLALRDSSVSHA